VQPLGWDLFEKLAVSMVCIVIVQITQNYSKRKKREIVIYPRRFIGFVVFPVITEG
jgi:hypothetical protein